MSLTLMQALRQEPTILGLFSTRPRLILSGYESTHLAARLDTPREAARDRYRAIEHLLHHEDAEATDREYRFGLTWAWIPGFTSSVAIPMIRPATFSEWVLRVTPTSPLDVTIRWIGDGRYLQPSQAAETLASDRFISMDDAVKGINLLRAEGWLREDTHRRETFWRLHTFQGGQDIGLDAPVGRRPR